MTALLRNKMLGVGAIACILLAVIGVNLYRRGRSEEAAFTITGTPRESHRKGLAAVPVPGVSSKAALANKAAPTEIIVHVAGAVRKPGVYHLKSELRAEDALKAAGGAQDKANLDAINLAAKLEDGTQLFIPLKGSSSGANAASEIYSAQEKGTGFATGRGSSSRSGKLSKPGKEFVNINTAGEAGLQQLPGVGPAMAARILQHRKENGQFTSPDQLMDVSGIGEKKFAKMKPFVKI